MSVNNLINNFVVRFANVNGTGSASANYLFAKAVFRMGIFATPKNIFPSKHLNKKIIDFEASLGPRDKKYEMGA